MLRQRLRSHTSPVTILGRVVLALVCLALIWYGLMLALLSVKVSPDFVDQISGYRTAYEYLAGLEPDDVTDTARLIAAIAGVCAFFLFGYMAWKELPRPYLARGDVTLRDEERGGLTIGPRAIERVAETAAIENPAVSEATGRFGEEEINVNVHVRRARGAPETLRDIQGRVAEALNQHELPPYPVNVTLTGFDREQRRELK